MEYNLTDVADRIGSPMLITSQAGEAYWPGQSRRLYDLLACPKKNWWHSRKVMVQTFIVSPTEPACAICAYSIGLRKHWDDDDAFSILSFGNHQSFRCEDSRAGA
jgi:hypothetical protein